MNEKLQALHCCWCNVTGQDLNFRATERLFFELFKMDFTADDLQCVLLHVIAYNKTHKHAPMKIQAHKLIGDLEVFGSILAEARAKQRNSIPKPTQREVVLHEFRGGSIEVPNGKPRHVSEIFDEMRKAANQ